MQTNTSKDTTIETFQRLILDWAKDKGILDNSTAAKQITKTIEEVKETKRAFDMLQEDSSNKLAAEELVDGVGDVLVTLVILTKLIDREFPYCDYRIPVELESLLEDAFCLEDSAAAFRDAAITLDELESQIQRIQRVLNYGGALHDFALNTLLSAAVHNLYQFCLDMDLDILECGMVAYRVISKRTGKMVNGIFVKDQA